MSEIVWGEPRDGVRFGLEVSKDALEAGGSVILGLVAESRAPAPVTLFGFQTRYPRSLRFSPPKADRPYVRVSFGDANVLHGPDAFSKLAPGQRIRTALDLSFAFDRRGAGRFPLAFAYDPVRAQGGLPTYGATATTGVIELEIQSSATLRTLGIDAALEASLDEALVRGDPGLVDRLRTLPGGPLWAARRVARTMASASEAVSGWHAVEVLAMLGDKGLEAARATLAELPHAAPSLGFAIAWTEHRMMRPAPPEHLPFKTMLDELASMPDRRGNFLLSWTAYDDPQHGLRRMEILGGGDRLVATRAQGEHAPTTRRTILPASHFAAIFESLQWSAVWLLVPLRAAGLPDEPRPALEVRLGLGEPFSRRIALWNGEWRQGPAAQLVDLLDRLAADGAR